MDDRIQRVYEALSDITNGSKHLILNKGNADIYMPLEKILFFETAHGCISAHTVSQVFETSYRLYELEELLPGYFMRVSKSTILNTNQIYSITRNLTASSEIQFKNTHKQVYVSRLYYKSLKSRLEEKRKSI